MGGTNGCTWREVSSSYKNASCVNSKVDDAVEAYSAACFASCSQPLNRTSDCYLECYRRTLQGDAGHNITKMPTHLVTEPWSIAIKEDDPAKGGCPKLKPDPCHGEQC